MPLSLSNFSDSDNDCFNPILEQIFWTVLMPNFLAQQLRGTKNTYIHENRISAVMLYLFYIRKVFLEGTSTLKVRRLFYSASAGKIQKIKEDVQMCKFKVKKGLRLFVFGIFSTKTNQSGAKKKIQKCLEIFFYKMLST